MKKILLLITVFLLFATNSHAFNYVRKAVITKNLKNDYAIAFDIDYRNNKHQTFRRHFDIQLGKKLENGVKIEGKFRHIYLQREGDWKLAEKRPQLQISKKFKNEYFIFEPRVRHDYQIFDGDDLNRTRLRLRFFPADKIFNLTPFISNEFYYEINASRFMQNRFEIGLIFPEFYKLTPSIVFREDSEYIRDGERWESDQIAVFRVDFEF